MKNLARLILALFAAQLLASGIAYSAVTSTVIDTNCPVCVAPGGGDGGDGGGF